MMPFWPNISLDIPVLSIIIAMSKLPVVHIVKANRRNRMPVESKVSKGATGIPFVKSISFMRIVILLPCFSIRIDATRQEKTARKSQLFLHFNAYYLQNRARMPDYHPRPHWKSAQPLECYFIASRRYRLQLPKVLQTSMM